MKIDEVIEYYEHHSRKETLEHFGLSQTTFYRLIGDYKKPKTSIKRTASRTHESYVIGGIELNDRTKEVILDGEPVSLTPKEFDILKLLISNPDRVFSPGEIYSAVWKENPYGTDNTVAVHIRHLREKLEINPAEPRYIKVIFGQGYKMEGERRK